MLFSSVYALTIAVAIGDARGVVVGAHTALGRTPGPHTAQTIGGAG